MELLSKLTDAGSMFWASLDQRERLIVLYALCLTLYLVSADSRRRAEAERERRLVERVRAELACAR